MGTGLRIASRDFDTKECLVQVDGSLRRLPGADEHAEELQGPWYEGNEVLLASIAAILIALGLVYLWQKRGA